MEITAEVLLNCLYLIINNCNDINRKLVQELVDLYEADRAQAAFESPDSDLIKFYIKLIGRIFGGNIDRTDPTTISRVTLLFKSDRAYETHRDMITDIENLFSSRDTMTVETLDKIVKEIKNIIVFHRIQKQLKTTYGKLNSIATSFDTEKQDTTLRSIKESMGGIADIFSDVANDISERAKCDTINFKDRSTIQQGVKKNSARNINGVIRTSWQGLNRACGKAGGFVAGESVCINALPHMYKTGLLVTIAMSAITCNNLKAETPGKIPLVYFPSLENETFQNMMWIFKKLYYKETGKLPDRLSEEQIVDWLTLYFADFGTELIIDRFIPSDFGVEEFKARIESLEDSGYEVKMVVIDYVNLMKVTGADGSASRAGRHHDICLLFRGLAVYCKNKGITFITAHPLNRKAVELAAVSTGNVVKKFGPEHLAESLDIEREVDMTFYLHLEYNHANVRFLTMKRGKHRYVDDTPLAHQFFAMPFIDEGVGILDDYGGAPGYVTDIQSYGMDDVDNANDNHTMSLSAVC